MSSIICWVSSNKWHRIKCLYFVVLFLCWKNVQYKPKLVCCLELTTMLFNSNLTMHISVLRLSQYFNKLACVIIEKVVRKLLNNEIFVAWSFGLPWLSSISEKKVDKKNRLLNLLAPIRYECKRRCHNDYSPY